MIGKKSVDVQLRFTADNSLPDPDHKQVSFDFKITINRNDLPGFYPNGKTYDRKDLTFNLLDYTGVVGGFNSIMVSGKEASSVSITDQLTQRPNPTFEFAFTLVEMRGSYKKGCGISDYGPNQILYLFNNDKVYKMPRGTETASSIDCGFTDT